MSVSSPDPERVRAWWCGYEATAWAESEPTCNGVHLAESWNCGWSWVWLAGSSPDYEAAARERYNEGDPIDWWAMLSDRGKKIRIEEATRMIHAAFPGLFEERP